MHSIEPLDQEIHVEVVHKYFDRLLHWCHAYPDGAVMLFVPNDHLPTPYCQPCHRHHDAAPYYRRLTDLVNPLGLHVHLARRGEIHQAPYAQQYNAIHQGLTFLHALGITTRDFAPGWWSFNHDTLQACRDLGLTRFHVHDWFLHTVPPDVPDDVTIVQVHHNSHDFMLAPVCSSPCVFPTSTTG